MNPSLIRQALNLWRNRFQNGSYDPLNGDLGHAAKIDGAGAAKAGRAGGSAGQQMIARIPKLAWGGQFGGSASKRNDHRSSEGSRHMHWATVVCQEQPALLQQTYQLPQ